jgi:hypothetical protein
MTHLEDKLREIVNTQVGISDEVKETLLSQILQAVTNAKKPESKTQGVTVMTQSASTAADQQMQGKFSRNQARPKSL